MAQAESAAPVAAPAAWADALHKPVMVEQCLDLLAPAFADAADAPHQPPLLIDCTLGMGGHSAAALARFPNLHVIGIDRDAQALKLASERLAPFAERFTAVHATYDQVAEVAARYSPTGHVAGVLMDLGVSSFQLDTPERGFSYARDAALDMRMDPSTGVTAADILRDASAPELTRILRVYGEEKFAARIAQRIVTARAQSPLTHTDQLVEIVRAAIPAPARRTGGNPAKRTFQALRIAVNDELALLEKALPAAFNCLRLGGRMVVEAYQSLEDRLVKETFVQASAATTPAGLPVELAGHEPYARLLTKGALKAPAAEIAANPRAQSVRIRAVEKVRAAAWPAPRHTTHYGKEYAR